jgi:GMP synthase-like glutamine amidotransferase
MRIACLTHHAAEGPVRIADWAAERGHGLEVTRAYLGDEAPAPDAFDMLVVMGGPMNVYDHDSHPWLPAEKDAIRAAAASGALLLGVCLGAQLLADALGGSVTRGADREIGWFPIELTDAARAGSAFRGLPAELPAFHWHGDTFSIPPGATLLASSAVCPAQAFEHSGGRVLGLQFHWELTPATLAPMLETFAAEVAEGGRFAQTPEGILADPGRFDETGRLLYGLLDRMAALGTSPS